MAVNVTGIISRRPGIEARALPRGTLLIDMSNGECFRLDQVGAEIWTLLDVGATVGSICDSLANRYPVGRSVLEADVQTLIDSLASSGLVDIG